MASAFPARGLASPRSAKISAIKAATLAFILVLIVCQIALAGRGTVSISAITDNGNGSYTLTVNSTSGMTVGDHFGARTGSSTGPGGVWEVMSIPSGISVIVSDTLTEENGTAFGLPQTGSAWFGTPTTSTDLSRPPHNAVAYDAALRRNYYLVDGKQPLDADLTTLGGLAKTDGNFIVADGSNWTVESGATARASLGLTIGTNVQAYDAQLADVAGLTPTDNAVVIGNGTNFVAESGATLKTSLGLTIGTDVQAYDADLTTIAAISGVKGDVLVHNGTDWIRLPVGTNGQVLEANSAVAAGVEWGTDDSSGGSSHDLLSATHTDTTAAAVTRGAVIVGNSTPKWSTKTVGAAGTVVASDGTDTDFRTLTTVINANVTEVQGEVLIYNGTNWVSGHAVDPGTAGGRLTGTDNTPVTTTDVVAAGTLYYEPYVGDKVAIYNGTAWYLHDISAGPSLDVTALTTGKNYDIFIYDNAGTPTLEASAAWTNDTTRADALALQDGVYVKSGTATRRYLGTIRTFTSSGTKTCDTQAARFIWNYQNRIPYVSRQQDGTTSWTYGAATIRGMNNGDADWKHEFVVGLSENTITTEASTRLDIGGVGDFVILYIGVNSSTAAATGAQQGLTMINSTVTYTGSYARATHSFVPAIGYSYTQGLESTSDSTAHTFYGGVYAAFVNTGMR